MINDAERREVARMLRELGKVVYSPDNTYELMAGALGVDDFEGTDELFNRLADLIEPSCDHDTPQKVTEEMFGKMRHPTKEEADAYDAMLKSKSVEIHPVDRDALLALADEIKNDTSRVDELQLGIYGSCYLSGIARRIRKALGVSNDE